MPLNDPMLASRLGVGPVRSMRTVFGSTATTSFTDSNR